MHTHRARGERDKERKKEWKHELSQTTIYSIGWCVERVFFYLVKFCCDIFRRRVFFPFCRLDEKE